MAIAKLHVSSEFFKVLSQEYYQLKLSLYSIETFVNKAWVHGNIERDRRSVFLIEQVLTFISMAKHHMEILEKLMRNAVIVD
jgi:predicted DNA-binding protein YlxM (UPF0122 family)